jgi:peptidoglycan/LPS O-acetylase OafA/YrhL
MGQTTPPLKPIFKNLDGIRFMAFLGVFISHCFYPRAEVQQSDLFKGITFFVGDSHWGDVGLYIFFTMSGFLITYLLIHEHQHYGKIYVFPFYMRRLLRIWPLYFLLLVVSFFVYPFFSGHHTPTETKLAYSFFYANFDVIKNGFDSGGIGHLWAISVEEQFYLLLPLSMLLVPVRYMNYLFILIITGSIVFRIAYYQEPTVLFHHSFSAAFDIAIGGLMAWLMYFSERAKNFVAALPRRIIILTYLIFCLLILFQDFIFNSTLLVLELFLFQVFAAFILLEQNYAEYSFFKIGNSWLITSLGRYAYGFYCYHILCIRFTASMAYPLGISGTFGELVIIPALSLLVTLAVGITSYYTFEIHFLKWKKNFTYLK